MGSPIDRDFLRFMKYMPDKYLLTIDQLKVKTLECENLKEENNRLKRTCELFQKRVQELLEKNEVLKRNGGGGNGRSLLVTPTPEPTVRRYPIRNFGYQSRNGGDQSVQSHSSLNAGYRNGSGSGGGQMTPRDRGQPYTPSASGFMQRSASTSSLSYGGLGGGAMFNSGPSDSYGFRTPSPPQPRPPLLAILPPIMQQKECKKTTNNALTAVITGGQQYTPLPLMSQIKQEPVDVDDVHFERVSNNDEHSTGFDGTNSDSQDRLDTLSLSGSTQQVKKPRIDPHPPSEMMLSGNFGVDKDVRSEETDITFGLHPSSTCFTSARRHELLTIMDRMKTYPTYCPFPSQHLVIMVNDKSQPERTSFYEILTRFLKLFGKHVHYFTYCSEMDSKATLWYEQITKFFRLMPNMKMIQLKILPPSSNDNNWSVENLNGLKLKRMCDRIKPFPALKQLVTIDFENVPYQILESILKRKGGTIQKLQVTRTIPILENWTSFSSIFLKNLSEFSMTFKGMDEVCQLQHVNWPLTNLTIKPAFEMNMVSTSENSPSDLVKISRVLEKFQKTLTSLKITLYKRPDPDARPILPQLRQLEVYFVEDASLNFILGLKSLEELKIHMEKEQEKDRSEDFIRLNGFINCMKNSNIWELMSSLKRLEITTVFDGVTKTYYHDNSSPSTSAATFQ